jgi:predicted transcriptional regulator
MMQNNQDEEVCPRCKSQLQLLKISPAAKIANISEKTIYGYIAEGSVHSLKIAGKTFRICKGCLVRPYDPML